MLTYEDRLALALRKRYVEQVAYAGFLMALQTNHIEPTPALITPYLEGLNAATRNVWVVLWDAYRAGVAKHYPGKAPQASFDPEKKCDGRCWNANPMGECSCKCGGAFHGQGIEAVRSFYAGAGV